MRPAALAVVALALTACAALGHDAALPLVREHATKDLDCSEKDIRVSEELGGRYKAVGCGRRAMYRTACVALTCEVRPEDGAPIPSLDRPEPNGMPEAR
jgi:hypothetical protein